MEVSEETPECCALKHSALQQMLLQPQKMKNEIHNLLLLLSALLLLQPPLLSAVDSSLISASTNSKFGVVDFTGVRNAEYLS